MKKVLLRFIVFYRHFKKKLINIGLTNDSSCRFYPTCSKYCFQAIEKYGSIRGLFICLKRVVRCHPWNKGGVDELI